MRYDQLLEKSRQAIRGGISLLIVYAMIVGGILIIPTKARAANPSSGTLNPIPSTNTVTWIGTKTGPAAPNGESDCATLAQSCDGFILTLGGTLANWSGKQAKIRIEWTAPAVDYDLYIHEGNSINGAIIASSGNANTVTNNFEEASINPASVGLGPFYVNTVYYAAAPDPLTSTGQYSGTASIETIPVPTTPPPSACTITPTYKNFQSPSNLGNSAGEPSIGVNWNTGNVMFQSVLDTLRVTFNDNAVDANNSPTTATWVSRSFRTTTVETLDPISFTDPVTGRTAPGQLLGGQSVASITDDDGETYIPGVSGGVASGVDHQTVGGGPFKTTDLRTFNQITGTFSPTPVGNIIGPTTAYPHAFYYASQNIAYAGFSVSRDGGVSYNATTTMMYNLTQCGGLHGHITVAPNDGTIYVPNKNCSGGGNVTGEPSKGRSGQGIAVSEDNGNSFAVRTVANSGSGDSDPSVAVGAGGKVYFAYTAGDKTIHVAVSDDKGVNFKLDQNIGLKSITGLPKDIRAAVFPQAIAGDNDRATVFFLGTDSTSTGDPTGTDGEDATTPPPDPTSDDFAGTWFPFMATTCNGGESWSVVRIEDPVQQGVICTNGTTCPSGTRNLLDFNGVVVDRRGRAIGGYADGCITPNCLARRDVTRTGNDATDKASIIRQSGGYGLFSAFDPVQ